jgi:serine/threonine protein kinase
MPIPSSRAAHVRTCFERACELRDAAQVDYLAGLESKDADLAHKVRELLRYDQKRSALDTSIVQEGWMLDALPGDPLPMPEQVGPYRIIEKIAAGGMATVYRANDPSLRREIALKVLPATPNSERLTSRFRLESQILSQLDHPGIAKVYAAGAESLRGFGCFYFAMELIEGRPFLEYIREERLDRVACIHLFLQVCDATEFAHSHGVIHRDLKPANILVNASGEAKLLDFGVARVDGQSLDTTTVETIDGRMIGTVTHVSPEQIAGDGAHLDRRTDVYSLGVLLYEAICGDSPYDLRGQSLAGAAQIVLAGRVRRPRSLGVQLAADLDAILGRALEAKPERRYSAVAELAADLRAFLAGKRVSAATNSRMRRWARALRRRPAAAAAASLLLVLVSVFAASGWLALRHWSNPHEIHTTNHGRVTLRSSSTRILYEWDFHGNDRVRRAALIERPESLGGGKIVALAMTNEVDDPSRAGQVVFYDAFDPGGPALWNSSAIPVRPPIPGYLERPEVRINVSPIWVDDFFPDRPGDEIAFFQTLDPYSPTVLRIVDTAGALLYQVWHDGTFTRLHLLKDSRRLIATGLNSEANWESRGHPGDDPLYPLVALALDLSSGYSNEQSWIVEDGAIIDPTVAWYRWFGPMESLGPLRQGSSSLRSAAGQSEPGAAITWIAHFLCPGVGPNHPVEMGFLMSRDGKLLARVPSEAFLNAAQKGLAPQAEDLRPMDYAELPKPR